MKETLTNKELRQLTLWGSEEPEEIDPGIIKDLRTFFPDWIPEELTDEFLEEKIDIPPSNLPEKFIEEINSLIGNENVKKDPKSRVLYSHGGSAEDLLRIRTGNFSLLAGAVIYVSTEEQIINVLLICERYGIAVIPVGGRTGVTRATHFTKKGIALDLYPNMTNIIDLNTDQRTVKVQTGIYGPDLEKALNIKGYTLGHFPQSYEQCTVGGWIASRSAGQNSTMYGKIEEMVLSLRIVTSKGVIEQFLTPACATGPQWFPYFIGSEGTLGIITEATLKIHPDTSANRKFKSYLFPSFKEGLNALKEICQSEFIPSIARFSDEIETYVYQIFGREGKVKTKDKLIEKFLGFKKLYPRKMCILILVFEGSSAYIKEALKAVKKASKGHGGFSSGERYAKMWFKDRYEHPHLRDKFLDMGILIDTLETASTWNNILMIQEGVQKALGKKVNILNAHCSHSYPEGSAIYFTYFLPIEKGREVEQCREMQKFTLDAFIENGGVTSHHHGVGKAFIPWARKEWGEITIRMAEGIKKELDPKNILNPGNFPFDKMNDN
ncbi:MAG: FAD-binding oxidoreductase [Candidatus Hodarchaeales archaeon]